MITTTYLQSDIINDGIPFLSPSNAPQQMTDTDEAINPILITFNAVIPFCIVTAFSVNNPISCPGIAQGESYTLKAGTSETTVTMDSLIYGTGNTMGR